jgi:hypothetical protein
MEQGYWLNVAQKNIVLSGPSRRDSYTHYCRVYCGEGDEARNVGIDVAKRFPSPRFKCELTHWESRGTPVLGVV